MSSQRKEASGEASLNGTNKSNEEEKTTTSVATKKDEEDGEDQWEDLYDEDDESMVNKLSEVTKAFPQKIQHFSTFKLSYVAYKVDISQ